MKRFLLLTTALIGLITLFSTLGQSTQTAASGCRITVTWTGLQTQYVPARDFFVDEWFWSLAAALSPDEPKLADFEWDNETSASATFGPVHYYLAPTSQRPWNPAQPPVLLSTTFSNSADVVFTMRLSNLVEAEPSRNSSFVTADQGDKQRVTCSSQAAELLGAALHDTYIGRHEFFYRIRIEPVSTTSP